MLTVSNKITEITDVTFLSVSV